MRGAEVVAIDTKKTETGAKRTHWDSTMCVYLPSIPSRLSKFHRWSVGSNRQDMNNDVCRSHPSSNDLLHNKYS